MIRGTSIQQLQEISIILNAFQWRNSVATPAAVLYFPFEIVCWYFFLFFLGFQNPFLVSKTKGTKDADGRRTRGERDLHIHIHTHAHTHTHTYTASKKPIRGFCPFFLLSPLSLFFLIPKEYKETPKMKRVKKKKISINDTLHLGSVPKKTTDMGEWNSFCIRACTPTWISVLHFAYLCFLSLSFSIHCSPYVCLLLSLFSSSSHSCLSTNDLS